MEERTIISFDYAIKNLLRDKANFDILEGFLSELLGRKVAVQAILESECNKDDPDGKTNRVDLKAQIDGGELAVFEIQFYQEIDFFGKVLYGVSRAVAEQVSVGGEYGIKKIYSINISYYNLGAQREYLFSGKFDGFRGVHFADETIAFAQAGDLAQGGAIVDIHPEYYLILPKMFDEQMRGRFDEWIYVLKKSAVRSDFTAKGLDAASAKLDLLKMKPDERRAYEKFLENRYSLDNVVRTAKIEERTEIAKNLKNMGIPAAQIAKAVGIDEENIETL